MQALFFYYDQAQGQTVLVLSGHRTTVSDFKPAILLERECLRYCSTLQGRIDGYRSLTGFVQKPAVLVSEVSEELFFPTEGIRNDTCMWIRYNSVMLVRRKTAYSSEVIFSDGSVYDFPYNERVLKQQMKRCRRLLELLRISWQKESHGDPLIMRLNAESGSI